MSLDQNLFTLAIAASADESGALDLTDPNTSTIHYRKRANPPDPANPYSWGLYDPLSNGLLCTVTAPSASSKQKWIELHNPEVKVELTFASSFSFKWNFDWEGHTFEWKRENCFLLRKPDPPVQVAVTREPAGRIKTSQVQILDYNLNRFDIEDRKGLEIVMLAALLTFQDYSESLRTPTGNDPPSRHNSDGPGPPPLPAKSGAEIISSLQAVNKAQPNDVIVGPEGQVEDYAHRCVEMLKDASMLYLVLRPQSPEHVGKVIQVAESTKRFYYKSGHHDDDLHQYVTMEDAKPEKKPPKVIKLDDDSKKKKDKEYKPPQTVTVHLSKIPMPELQPKAPPSSKPSPGSSSHGFFSKNGGRNPSPSRPSGPSAPASSSSTNKLSNPSNSPSPLPNQPVDLYRYTQLLYPPTAPSPVVYESKPKLSKQDGKKPQGNDKKPRPSPSPSASGYQMPGSYPSTPGSSGPGAMNSNRPPPPPSGGYPGFTRPPPPPGGASSYPGGPPPGPPPGIGQQQQQSASLSAALTNNIANVGYSLLDKLTHKQVPSGPTKQ